MNHSHEQRLFRPLPEHDATPLLMCTQGLRDVLDRQIENPPQGDMFIRAYAMAMRFALDTDGPIAEFVHETLKHQPQFEGSYLINKIRSALQDHLYFPDENRVGPDEPHRHRIMLHENGKPLQYPQDFISPEIWATAFEAILDDPDVFGEFIVDVWGRPLASNVPGRGAGIKIFASMAQQAGRLGGISLADIGCSQQAIGNYLISDLPFERITVMKQGSQTGTPSISQTRAVNSIMNSPLDVTHITGFDMYYPRETRSWARSCSHYPSELLNQDRVALYDRLITADPENVHFYRTDFTEFDHDRFVAEQKRDGKPTTFKIVNFTTILYQASPEEREVMLANARKIAEEFIIVQDFVGTNPQNPSQLIFRENWQDDPFPYRTLVMDLREELPVWHEIFRWRDGRCREMTIGLGRIALQKGLNKSIWTPTQ